MCMYVCVCVKVCPHACRYPCKAEEGVDSLKLELQTVVHSPKWVQGRELRSSPRSVSAI